MGVVRSILGPDFQSMASKVFWTFVQTFASVLIASEQAGWNLSVVESAVTAGVASGLVPITVYARQMIGGGINGLSGRSAADRLPPAPERSQAAPATGWPPEPAAPSERYNPPVRLEHDWGGEPGDDIRWND